MKEEMREMVDRISKNYPTLAKVVVLMGEMTPEELNLLRIAMFSVEHKIQRDDEATDFLKNVPINRIPSA